jgi:pimeloyl-ACP methyl ester carboxylesterase
MHKPGTVFREHFVDVGGFRTRYLDGGDGPPVVLVPTMFLPADSYRPTMAHLSRRFRVIAVDTPGTGRSQPLRERWTFERYADWVADFLDVLGLGPVPVIGHSNSGGLVIVLAARHPQALSHAILADPIGAAQSNSLWRLIPVHLAVGMLELSFSALVFPHIVYNMTFHWGSFWNQIRIAPTDLTVYAPRVSVPTLLAWGGQDLTMPPDCAGRYQRLIPRARIILSPGGSHDWIIARPAQFAAAVRRFLSDTPGASGGPGDLLRALTLAVAGPADPRSASLTNSESPNAPLSPPMVAHEGWRTR